MHKRVTDETSAQVGCIFLSENLDERIMEEISTLGIFDPSSQGPSMFGGFEGEQQSLEMGHSPPSIMLQPFCFPQFKGIYKGIGLSLSF
jgi:hypothetical protein